MQRTTEDSLALYRGIRSGEYPLLAANYYGSALSDTLARVVNLLSESVGNQDISSQSKTAFEAEICALSLERRKIEELLELRAQLDSINWPKRVPLLHQHLGSAEKKSRLWIEGAESSTRHVKKQYRAFYDGLTNAPGKQNYDDYLARYDTAEQIQSGTTKIRRFIIGSAHNLKYNQGMIFGTDRFDPGDAPERLFLVNPEIRANLLKRTGATAKGNFMDGPEELEDVFFQAVHAFDKVRRFDPEFDVGLIATFGVDVPERGNRLILERIERLAAQFPGVIIGIDVAGNEDKFPYSEASRRKLFAELYRSAPRYLGRTLHLLETQETSALTALNVLDDFEHLDRIGHGIAAAQHYIASGYKRGGDEERLLRELQARGIVLEICGYSNLCSGKLGSYEELGAILNVFDDFGVRYAFGQTDAAEFHGVNMAGEFMLGLISGHVSVEQIQRSLRVAADATFMQQRYGYDKSEHA